METVRVRSSRSRLAAVRDIWKMRLDGEYVFAATDGAVEAGAGVCSNVHSVLVSTACLRSRLRLLDTLSQLGQGLVRWRSSGPVRQRHAISETRDLILQNPRLACVL